MSDNFFEYDSERYHYRYFTGNTSNAIILLIHGLGEHVGRYEQWAKRFNPYNYAVCALDLPGHGLSYGKRGHVKQIENIYDIIDIFIDKIKEDFPEKPIILYGHSMGGNIAANYLIKRTPSVKALILSSPWIRLAIKPNFFKFQFGKLMYKLYPKFSDKTGLDPNFISRIPEEVNLYKYDKLVHGRITPALFFPLFFNGLALLSKTKKIYCPTLVFHGSGDNLTSHKASEQFALGNDKIDFVSYEGGFHELHHDVCRDELFENILDWLSIHVVMR